jgi:exonuclease SbcC
MLLQSLKLKNIRSYTDQTINFPENSTLLSGDIGSGKSTLLLAIEFALFGICKPDLTGETLLRKGETNASVELSFRLNNQNITIQRNLKKNKNNISQTPGHIIINNLKKDLTPVELKTEIINLLNYPEDTITKSKNYIFRYTLYCPQEEMKLILQENPDNRLGILRKIFNLDKYKRIRENVLFYLKKIRIKSTVLKTRLEPLDQKKSQLETFRKQQKQLTNSFNLLLPQLSRIKEDLQNKKRCLEELEQKNHLHLNLKNQLLNTQNILREKEKQRQALSQKQKQLEQALSQLTISENKEALNNQLQQLQKQHQEFLSQRSEISAEINHCQQRVADIQKEISQLTEQTSVLRKKEEEIKKTEKELVKKEKITKEKEKIENELDRIKQNFHQNQLLLSQAQEIKNKISQIDQCPTCLQQVPLEHKKNIFRKEQQKIEETQKQLKESEQKKSLLQKQFLEIAQQFDSLLKKENQLIRLQTELLNLKEKQNTLQTKKEQLQDLVKENNSLINGLEKLKPEELEKLNQQIFQKQELLQKLVQKQELEKNLTELTQNLKEINPKINNFNQEKNRIEQQLSQNPDLTPTLIQQKKLSEELTEEEKDFLSQKTKLSIQSENCREQIDSSVEEINRLNQFKSHLIKLNEIHYWVNEFLIKLTYTIEKHVMVNIHHLFNNLFQEWFSILVEEENFSARLDDSFTPVIEQDGYEIFFNNLSGGERTAAALSYRLALNKVINDVVHEIKTKDLLILDEPTDGFSSEQLDKIRDILEKLNLKQTIIVSHESKIESFVENVIRINKNEGISQVI